MAYFYEVLRGPFLGFWVGDGCEWLLDTGGTKEWLSVAPGGYVLHLRPVLLCPEGHEKVGGGGT